MNELLSKMLIPVNPAIYLKNPETSELGRKIIGHSIDLIEKMGFEAFTFGKLSKAIKSPEASVYRYFESKHKLLLYLTSWYWGWLEYKLVFSLANIQSPDDRLGLAIKLLTRADETGPGFPHINISKLHRIVISDSSKAYLTKEVDNENKHGVFVGYKQLVKRVASIVREVNPKYKYPHMLISDMIEGAHHQHFFSKHLPSLTDSPGNGESVTSFYMDMVFKTIKN